MRTNRHDERDHVTERPAPETPEPLEEAPREPSPADTGRDMYEGPGPVYSPGDARSTAHADDTGDGTYPDGPASDVHGDAATGATAGEHESDADRNPEAYGTASIRDGRPLGGTRATADAGIGAAGTPADSTVDGPVAYPATVTTAAFGEASVSDEALEGRWREVKAGFVDDPRQSIEQADALLEEALSAFTTRRRALLDQWEDTERGDTEALRLALHEYHALLAQLIRK